jgi:Glycine rich protein
LIGNNDTQEDIMRRRKLTQMALALLLALALIPLLHPAAAQAASGDCVTSGNQVTCTFSYTGAAQTWTVPDKVISATFDVSGAEGGPYHYNSYQRTIYWFGANGGEAKATLAVTPGATYQITVGGAGGRFDGDTGGGFNGGGAGGADRFHPGGPGGGASDVRSGACASTTSCDLAARIIIAGGGGGTGGDTGGGYGGGGGGAVGGAGGDGDPSAEGDYGRGGGGGTSRSGGGSGYYGGGDGTPGSGGGGQEYGGGGGGGGYYGGGGGGGYVGSSGGGGGGGGGSGYITSSATNATLTAGVRSGDGLITITYTPDTTAPTASPAVTSGTPGANGWYLSDVTVSWNWSDNAGGFGIDPNNCTSSSTSSGEGTLELTASCKDLAGNQGSASSTVKVDTTRPTISAAATSQPNTAGWYNTPVTVHFNCSDALSGIPDGACPTDQILSAEGAAVSSSAQTVSDVAGNTSEPSNVVTVQIDTTAPTLAPVVSPNSVVLGGTATVTSGAADALSGLASQSCTSLDTSTAGSKSVSCTATDNAGNTATASVSYQVIYAWAGFFQPIDNLPTLNSVKAGSGVPVKFSLGGDQGLSIFAAGYPKSQTVACTSGAPTDDVEQTVSASASSLQYDAATGQYSYVWKTEKSWAGTCRQLIVRLIDGTEHTAGFTFK